MFLWRLPDLPNQLFDTDYLRIDKFSDSLERRGPLKISLSNIHSVLLETSTLLSRVYLLSLHLPVCLHVYPFIFNGLPL